MHNARENYKRNKKNINDDSNTRLITESSRDMNGNDNDDNNHFTTMG